jgi:hypothetical protein
VLRASGRAKRLHRLEELASQNVNRNAAVAANKAAEQLGDESFAGSSVGVRTPGMVIVIENNAAPSLPAVPRIIEHNPPPAESCPSRTILPLGDE